MVRLQSQSGNNYEFDPATSLIGEDVWGKIYQGVCCNASESRDVRIYELETNSHLPEYLLRRLRVESHFCYSHPNIIPFIDFIANIDDIDFIFNIDGLLEEDYRLYFIEDNCFGFTLSNFLRGQICTLNGNESKSINELCFLFRHDRTTFAKKVIKEVLQGINYIHNLYMYLRYVNPERIIITDDGAIKLSIIDYFLYDVLNYSLSDLSTSGRQANLFSSFPVSYCSPEMILMFDDSNIYYRSDIYSVGILFFHLLTGHIPYKGHYMEIISQHLNGKIPLCEIEDKQLRKIVKKATEKNPSKRYQSAYDFIHAIDKMDEDVVWYKKIWPFFSCL